MKIKALLYAFFFILVTVLINYINLKIEKAKLKDLTYKQGTIYDFVLISKNSERVVVKGDKLIDKLEFLEGYNVNSFIKDNDKKINIRADLGIFDKKSKIELKNNVTINFNQKINLYTDNIIIDMKRHIAFNNTENKLISKNMKTFGKDIILDFKAEKIHLKNVKTQILGE